MKKVLTSLLLSCALVLGTSSCAKTTATTPPAALAPGALNTFDQIAYQTLAGAHAFVATASANAATLTAAQKSALNVMINAVNVAQVAYISYHNGNETQAAVQVALNAVASAQTTYANSVVGTKASVSAPYSIAPATKATTLPGTMAGGL